MHEIEFKATIALRGYNPYIAVSAEQAAAIAPGWKRPIPVLVQLNGGPTPPWRINIMPVGDGSFYLYLDNRIRKPTGTAVGDDVTVTLGFDADYRAGPAHDMPDDLAAALLGNSAAASNWERLPPSRKKEVLRYLARLQSPSARRSNLDRLLHVLEGKEGRYLARQWKNGA
jgi:hypothetical protein